jgi:hypothetical protein
MKSKRSEFLKGLSVVIFIFASFTISFGQDRAGVVELKSAGCEIDEANFNIVRVDALERLGENGFLIAVARLGIGDRRRNLNRSRLSATREWLRNAAFPVDRLVLAEGERVSGNGRVEFYIGGKLTHVILPKPNVGLCIECCNPRPEDFTTYRGRRKKRR